MRVDPPENFDARAFLADHYVFQQWDIFKGFSCPASKDVVQCLDNMGFPADLTGKRVLDIAPWNGFFSFECVRRGAAQVVSFGPEDPKDTGYQKVKDLLEIDNCEYRRGSVYDLRPETLGEFDIVLFLGLIYHLRHPLLALDRIFDVCKGSLFVDTPFIDNVVFDLTLDEETRRAIQQSTAIHQLPMLYFTKGSETGDYYNWFMPNLKALGDLVESSGFEVTLEGNDGSHWCWLSARKTKRAFVEGLEGYNPGSAKASRQG